MSPRPAPPPTRHRKALTALAIALATACIAGPVLAIGMPSVFHIPIVKMHAKGQPQQASAFSHWSHDQFDCSYCHPSIFPKTRAGFTHDDMHSGKFCGTCHDNKTAFSSDAPGVSCSVCHRR